MTLETICGYIERITFQNDENGFTIAHLKIPSSKNLVCIVGNLPGVTPGETIRCTGSWTTHLIHGKQFAITEFKSEVPADIEGIRKYLGSGLIKGIGNVYAGRIVEKFGIDTLHILDTNPDQLSEIEGLGKKRIEKIKECWSDQRSIRDVMIFLQSNGVTPAYAQKIYKVFGNNSIKKITENPYVLARDVHGIGFKTADEVAQRLGIGLESIQRIDAGIEFVLNELSGDGHVCFPVDEFIVEGEKILDVHQTLIQNRLGILKEEGRIELFELIYENRPRLFIWGKNLFSSEVGIAHEIKRLVESNTHLRKVDLPKAIEWVQAQLKIELAEYQRLAVENALSIKMQIITGGPGTGKSTITNAILKITEKLTDKIMLAAPTGRAAKRMNEITGKKASTIHSLLEFDFKNGGFKRKRGNPLDCDLLIVDEASMIDTYLMYSLLKAVPDHCRVIFVGDINQLPSVGPGNVLRDIIQSNCVAVNYLSKIFRQAQNSSIVVNAHRINEGLLPDLSNEKEGDFFFIERENPDNLLKEIVTLVSQRLPRKYGFHPLEDIQVLVPMRKGILGIDNLNTVLQERLNPRDNPLFRFGRKFLLGDKVMQIRNNYDKNVFNGDIGFVKKIISLEQQLVVDMEGRDIFYEFAELDELVLAYAMSIHKSQGNESKCVVIPIHTSHFILLCRNLLYTGVTRGKKLVVLVGTKKAVNIAVNNDDVRKRYTGLKQAMIGINNYDKKAMV